MKSKSKTKPRAPSQIALLRSINRLLQVIAKNTEPLVVGSSEAKVVIRLDDDKARFIKLDTDGKQLPAGAKSWSAVRDTKLGLDWSADDIGEAKPFADAQKACADLSLCGTKNWRLPTVEELFVLADRTRREPAIDVAFFPSCKGSYYWTSSPCAGNSDDAWIVNFYGGFSYWGNHGLHYSVRACRPSQF